MMLRSLAVLPLVALSVAGCAAPDPEVEAQAAALTLVSGKIVAPDLTTSGWFGFAVAIDGATALIGAHGANAAYVFVDEGSGWTFQQKLSAPDDFGWAVALEGDLAAVGAPGVYLGPGGGSGLVYLYRRTGTTWSPVQRLGSSFNASEFGATLAIDRGTLVVGAPYGNVTEVFADNGATFVSEGALTPSNGARYSDLGRAVGVSGDRIVVGAQEHSITTSTVGGAAYVFERANHVWTMQASLLGHDTVWTDGFGRAVGVDGDTIVVGAPFADNWSVGTPSYRLREAGSAYVFRGGGARWVEQAKLVGQESGSQYPNSRFGKSIAISGSRIVAGATDNYGAVSCGSVYLFGRNGTSWGLQDRLIAFDYAEYDYFGSSVALRGEALAIGADGVGGNVNISPGAVYLIGLTGVGAGDAGVGGDGGSTGDGGSASADSGSTGGDGGNASADGGNTGADGGTTGADAGNTSADGGGGDPPIGDAASLDGDLSGPDAGTDDGATLGDATNRNDAMPGADDADLAADLGTGNGSPDTGKPGNPNEQIDAADCNCRTTGRSSSLGVWMPLLALSALLRRRSWPLCQSERRAAQPRTASSIFGPGSSARAR